MITSIYSIAKNELHNLDNWLHYSRHFSYKVILDTGSTDGTWEALQECASSDPTLIIKQVILEDFRFDTAKNLALGLCPFSDFYLAPDMDEWFTENTIDVLSEAFSSNSNLNNLLCDRFDIYSRNPRLGPSVGHPAFNKIHSNKYKWIHPVYEYLEYQDDNEKTIYSDKIFIIHNQKRETRDVSNNLYISIMQKEAKQNPKNTWNLWYYLWYLGNINSFEYKEYAERFLLNSKDKERNEFVNKKMKELKELNEN